MSAAATCKFLCKLQWYLTMLTLTIQISPSLCTDYKIGVLVINGHGSPYDMERSGAAIQLGLERVNREIMDARGDRLVPIFRTYGPECDRMRAAGLAADLYYTENIVAFIGPGCTHALDHVARLAGYWNIPIVTGLGDSGIFKEKTDFPTLTRMSYCQCRLRRVIGSLLSRFNWTDITLFIDRDDLHAQVLGDTLDAGLQKGGYLPEVIQFYGDEQPDYGQLLTKASQRSRVFILSIPGPAVREILLEARSLGYIDTGDYVFIDIELFYFPGDYWGDHSWERGDEDDEAAKQAYEALLRIALFEPNGPDYDEFSKQVKLRAKEEFNYTYGDEKVNFFVGAFYDSTWLYGMALNETLALAKNPADGYAVARRMWDRNFAGITGNVFVDDNGDRDTSFAVMDMNTDTGIFHPVSYYWGDKPGYNPVSGVEIHWAGGRDTPPLNTPLCGYQNENPECQEKEGLSVTVIVLVTLLCLVSFGGFTGFLIYRKAKEESELNDMTWLINSGEIEERRDLGLSSTFCMSMVSVSGSKAGDSRNGKVDKQIFTKVGNYKNMLVALRAVSSFTHTDLNRQILREIRQRRMLNHDNVSKFIGAVLDTPEVKIVYEYCRKGSLQDILANDSISLDSVFKMSLMQDIIKGITYIHDSDVLYHGRLHSSNCLVDSRFVLKLTDFGLPSFYNTSARNYDYSHQFLTRQYWLAPEHLRSKRATGTQKGDIYSFGIILSEIITRSEPYENINLEPKVILDRVKSAETPPFRPSVEDSHPAPHLRQLMTDCWHEDPRQRPTLSAIKSTLLKANKGRETNIMDDLLSRMEQYANNLEGIVAERTQLLVQEQAKTEQLLLEILPRTIAEQLKQGRSVNPESFESVTVYFSDIVGFTSLSAESTPIQVVNMLNDLYTLFDAILEEWDVYKVETIGDAYMVASGLPVLNGNKHAGEIASVAVRLRRSITHFRVRHKPDVKVKLRIGMHTGSCVAGVVGLKMPRYCLFGDTVNTASRMESNGAPEKIHMSADTYDLLREDPRFRIEERGTLDIKGKGLMKTYWLLDEIQQIGT